MLNKISEIHKTYQYDVIISGDFNAPPSSFLYNFFTTGNFSENYLRRLLTPVNNDSQDLANALETG